MSSGFGSMDSTDATDFASGLLLWTFGFLTMIGAGGGKYMIGDMPGHQA